MPRWLILILVILGCTLVPFVFVLGHTQNLREALGAWKNFAIVLAVLATPAAIAALVSFIQSL